MVEPSWETSVRVYLMKNLFTADSQIQWSTGLYTDGLQGEPPTHYAERAMGLNHAISICLFVAVFLMGMMTGCRDAPAPSDGNAVTEGTEQETSTGTSGDAGPSVCEQAMLAKVVTREESLTKACLLPVSLIPLVSGQEKGGEENHEVFAQNILNASEFIERACPDYDAVFRSLVKIAPDGKKEALISGCHLERLGVASKEELLAYDGTKALIGCAVYQWMSSHHIVGAKEAMRAWMSP
jgi:hypothetical protein